MNRTTYGLDNAKNVMQLHWVDTETGEIGRKKLAEPSSANSSLGCSRCAW